MREIVSIQVGGGGNKIGSAFWEKICNEHGIDATGSFGGNEMQLERADVFFNEDKEKYVSRSILCDLDSDSMDIVKNGKYSEIFSNENFVFGKNGGGITYARGFYQEGSEIISSIIEKVRKETEKCDNLQGFDFIHTLGGGCGSGLTSLILQRILEEYPDRMLVSFPVFPAPNHRSDTCEYVYNTLLALHQHTENTDLAMCIQDEALLDICYRTLRLKSPRLEDRNEIITSGLSDVTCSLRFPCEMKLNSDLRRLGMNLCPFPRLKFLMIGHAPIFSPEEEEEEEHEGEEDHNNKKKNRNNLFKVKELNQQMYNGKNLLCTVDPRNGRYLSSCSMFRGIDISSYEVHQECINIQNKGSSYWVEWIPNNVKYGICPIPQTNKRRSATTIGNNTSIQYLFQICSDHFNQMFRRKAFLHWWTNHGMEEMDFTEAESNTNDLISEYQQYQDASADDDYSEEEEEEEEEGMDNGFGFGIV